MTKPDITNRLWICAVPGFIDGHVHILGGGGEGGFKMRTPELKLTTLIKAGVTTVVGCLGTDGISRTIENLIAKVYSLREEGVSAYCYTGSYQVPIKTLTGSVISDIMLLDPVIGVGEVAISDHRSSSPDLQEIARIGSDARGVSPGKSGVVNCHRVMGGLIPDSGSYWGNRNTDYSILPYSHWEK